MDVLYTNLVAKDNGLTVRYIESQSLDILLQQQLQEHAFFEKIWIGVPTTGGGAEAGNSLPPYQHFSVNARVSLEHLLSKDLLGTVVGFPALRHNYADAPFRFYLDPSHIVHVVVEQDLYERIGIQGKVHSDRFYTFNVNLSSDCFAEKKSAISRKKALKRVQACIETHGPCMLTSDATFVWDGQEVPDLIKKLSEMGCCEPSGIVCHTSNQGTHRKTIKDFRIPLIERPSTPEEFQGGLAALIESYELLGLCLAGVPLKPRLPPARMPKGKQQQQFFSLITTDNWQTFKLQGPAVLFQSLRDSLFECIRAALQNSAQDTPYVVATLIGNHAVSQLTQGPSEQQQQRVDLSFLLYPNTNVTKTLVFINSPNRGGSYACYEIKL